MRLGEGLDVDIVAHRAAVRRRIVGAVDVDLRPPAERRRQHERHEMRLGIVRLADLALGVGAGGVKIAQGGVGHAMGLAVPVDRSLADQLALAIGIDRILRRILGDRHARRRAVGGAARGKDDVAQLGRQHGVEQGQGVNHVVVEVELRLDHRFADIGEGGEVDHRRHLETGQRVGQQLGVGKIALDQRPPAHRLAVAVDEIVIGDRRIAGLGQSLAGMTADIAGTAGNQDVLAHRIHSS